MPLYRPSQDTLGVLVKSKTHVVEEFEDGLRKSINDLDVAMLNLQTSIQLERSSVDLSAYQAPADFANAIHHPEIITSLEGMYT